METVSALATTFEVYLILPGTGPLADRSLKNGIEPVIISNPQIAITDASPARKLSIAADRIRYVRKLQQFFQSNHINLVYVNTSASLFPALAAKLAHVPIAWHIHETLDSDDRRTRWKKRIIRRWADGLIYASKSSMQLLCPPPGTRTIIARNAIRVAELEPMAKARFASKEMILRKRPVIVMNGTIARKGADVLLRALQILRQTAPDLDFEVVIAGMPPTEPPFATKLQDFSASQELDGRVTFAGIQESLSSLLADADLFISPARNEALPIAIVEAMAAGVPVIATAVGDCADLLDNGQCGWVVSPGDPAALASAIAEALNQPHLSQARAEVAFAKVMADYGAEDFWQLLTGFLNSLIANASPN